MMRPRDDHHIGVIPRPPSRAVVVDEPELSVVETAATAAPESVQDALRLMIRWTLRSMGRDAGGGACTSMHASPDTGETP
jgi:hypothetical protein